MMSFGTVYLLAFFFFFLNAAMQPRFIVLGPRVCATIGPSDQAQALLLDVGAWRRPRPQGKKNYPHEAR